MDVKNALYHLVEADQVTLLHLQLDRFRDFEAVRQRGRLDLREDVLADVLEDHDVREEELGQAPVNDRLHQEELVKQLAVPEDAVVRASQLIPQVAPVERDVEWLVRPLRLDFFLS